MKALITAMLLLAGFVSYSQATTQTEYNYMKTGYKSVEESGMDVKKGYSVQELGNQAITDLTMNFLIMKRADSSIAGIIVKSVSTALLGSGTKWYCIPAVSLVSKESYGWNDFYKEVSNMTDGQKQVIIRWLSYSLMYDKTVISRK